MHNKMLITCVCLRILNKKAVVSMQTVWLRPILTDHCPGCIYRLPTHASLASDAGHPHGNISKEFISYRFSITIKPLKHADY